MPHSWRTPKTRIGTAQCGQWMAHPVTRSPHLPPRRTVQHSPGHDDIAVSNGMRGATAVVAGVVAERPVRASLASSSVAGCG